MTLQDIIHYIEVGAGKRYLRFLLPCVLIIGVAILRDFRTWTNFSTPEAMDSAQLARNIADGKGYTTLLVRPLSLYLVEQHNESKTASSTPDTVPDFARIKTAHPDLANPPVYPVVLAGLMKILPFNYGINLKSVFWANNGLFWRYQPDFLIGIFNLLLFLASVVVTFFIARKIFDASVARLATVLMLVCSTLWRFSSSGLSTILLLLIFLGVVWCVLKIEELARDEQPDMARILSWSVGVGILTGIGALTRYAFGWAIIPVAVFVILFSGPKKLFNVLGAFAAFVIVLAPWIARNVAVSGTPFGTAGYAIFAHTSLFPEYQMERSLHPDLSEAIFPIIYWHKFLLGVRPIFENDLFKLGGTWAGVLFFAGLLLRFNRPTARRMRYFLLMCMGMFIIVQALGRTWLSDASPEINSENLLVLLLPLIFIFGTAFFLILLDQIILPAAQLRYIIVGIFIGLCSLPLFFSMWFKSSPVAYPPYYPPDIVKAAGWMNANELMMSDTPWAVAWYGQRQCVWLTDDDTADFFSVNDYLKPVSALYLTMETMDGKLVSDCFRSDKDSWGRFVLGALTKNQIPPGFPLRNSPSGTGTLISGLFLTDKERWKIGANSGQ
jgi:hypothetical protein